MTTSPIGSNTTSTSTSAIQTALGGGLTVDNKYGAQTTEGVKAFQAANGLTVDGDFGPKTQAAFNNKFNGGNSIVSTGDVHREAKVNSAALTSALGMFGVTPPASTPAASSGTPNGTQPNTNQIDPTTGQPFQGVQKQDPTTANPTSDPYIDQLNAIAAKSNTSTKMLINNIIASDANKKNTLDKQYDDYTRGLQLLGIQSNAAQSSPDLLMGHINDAKNEHMEKVNAIDADESKTLMDAETARSNNDFKTLQDKMSYLKTLQTDKAQALKDLQAATASAPKNAAIEAHDIYDTLDTLDDADKESFIQAVASKFQLPLGSLVTALTDEKSKRDAADLKETNTKSILDKRENPTTKTKEESPTKKAADAKEEVTNALKTGKDANGNVIGNPRGSDTYADPSVYIAAMNAWPGTPADFVSKFSVASNVNPASYNLLPKAIQPKAKTSRGS